MCLKKQNICAQNFAKLKHPKRLQPTSGKNAGQRRGRPDGHLRWQRIPWGYQGSTGVFQAQDSGAHTPGDLD